MLTSKAGSVWSLTSVVITTHTAVSLLHVSACRRSRPPDLHWKPFSVFRFSTDIQHCVHTQALNSVCSLPRRRQASTSMRPVLFSCRDTFKPCPPHFCSLRDTTTTAAQESFVCKYRGVGSWQSQGGPLVG